MSTNRPSPDEEPLWCWGWNTAPIDW